jgi:O-antigen ligase
MDSRQPSTQEISLLLVGALFVLPFLIPYHQPPIASFYSEWLAGALAVSAVAAAFPTQSPVRTPAMVFALTGFAAFMLARVALGAAYAQPALMGCLYCACACMLVWLGAQLRQSLGLHRVTSTLATFILAGALANALAGVIQFHGRPLVLENLVAQLNGGRVYGNIAQPNLYVNYVALGMASLLFLWQARALRSRYAVPALALLAYAASLTLSRSSLLYPAGLTTLALLLPPRAMQPEHRRLKLGAVSGAMIVLAVQLSTFWLHATAGASSQEESAIHRMIASDGSDPRLEIWATALRIIASAPISGVGVGQFPGAAFDAGLSPQLTRYGSVWVSPHSLPLHLLAETGLAGAVLILGSLIAWMAGFMRRFLSAPDPESWWILALVGIQVMHSLFEAPLWSAHFLAVTAVLIGMGGSPGPASKPAWRVKAWLACTVLVMTIALALILRDYVRLDSTRITGAALTLSSQESMQRDVATLEDLSRGFLGPTAEYWMLSGAGTGPEGLQSKLELSYRVARLWPVPAVLTKRSIYLALDGQSSEALKLIDRTLESFPQHCRSILGLLEEAAGANPSAISPLLQRTLKGSCALDRPKK